MQQSTKTAKISQIMRQCSIDNAAAFDSTLDYFSMITTLLAPKPIWLTLFLGQFALAITILGGISVGVDFWSLLSLLAQLFLGLIVLTLAVALTCQHKESARSGLSAIIGALVCIHALALVLGSIKGI
jgi:hypothetical protein